MKAGLHLAAGVEGVAGGVDGEGLDAGLGKVRNTVLKIELISLILGADTRDSLDGHPARSTLALGIVILIAGGTVGGNGAGGCVRGAVISFCVRISGNVGICGIRSNRSFWQLVPPGHHFTVTEGEIISTNLFIYLVLDHFSGAVKIEPCSFFLWIFIADI